NGTERIRTVKHSVLLVLRIVVDLNLPSLRIRPYASRCPRKVVADSHSGGDIRLSGNVVLVIDDRSHRVKPSAATTVIDIAFQDCAFRCGPPFRRGRSQVIAHCDTYKTNRDRNK